MRTMQESGVYSDMHPYSDHQHNHRNTYGRQAVMQAKGTVAKEETEVRKARDHSFDSGELTPNGGHTTVSSLGSVSSNSDKDMTISDANRERVPTSVTHKISEMPANREARAGSVSSKTKKVSKSSKRSRMINSSSNNNNNNNNNNNIINSSGTPNAVRNHFAQKKGLSAEERKLFLRIEQEWREEDAWNERSPGTISTVLWTPILIGLRCFNIWLSVVMWPAVTFARVMLGWNIQNVSVWDMPLEKRKQTLAVLGFVMLLPCVVLVYTWSLILLIFPLTTFPMIMYFVFIFYIDKSAENGQRRPFIRYWSMWRHFANYFPLRLICTEALPPTRKYVFAYHPHGIISVGAFGNFATNATGFSRKFPGINLRLLTLEMNFWCPWLREFLLHMGVCSASKRSCNKILSKGPGSAIMLVVGGAAESLDTEPGTYRLTLDRKGFIRVALDNGADLVPVLGFGENDVFDTMYYPPNSMARSVQEWVRKKLGFATPVFRVMPHRKPIIVVVGKPIKLPMLPAHLKGSALCTTAEGIAIVDKYHQIYLDALRDIWDMYKNRWAVHRAGSLLLKTNRQAPNF